MIKTVFGAIAFCMAIALPASPSPVPNWDGTVSGTITGLHLTHGSNYAFRIYIEGQIMCTGGSDWAFMNVDWNNYQATSAFLITSWASGKRVVIYSTLVGGACQIGYVQAA